MLTIIPAVTDEPTQRGYRWRTARHPGWRHTRRARACVGDDHRRSAHVCACRTTARVKTTTAR